MRYWSTIFWSFSLLFLINSAYGQAALPPADPAKVKKYTYTENMPIFPGLEPGDSARSNNERVVKFINDSIHFPPQALRDGVRGRVSFSFTVNAQGRTTDVKLVQGVRADVDAEVLRSAHRLDRIQWRPGTQNGRPVSVAFTVPITFNAEANGGPSGASAGDSLEVPAFNKLALPASPWGTDRRIFPSDRGLVYGSCIQHLGFDSGGFGQYVRLVNLTTGKSVRIEVKPPFRSRKQNAFCFARPPGRYAPYKYEFTASKWYGGEKQVENLHKFPGAGVGNRLGSTRYLFTVPPGKLHYLGTWNLEQENMPVFLNEKAQLDAQLIPIFKNLHFDTAVAALPE